jgi:DNA (cytosine-5)-methyltransferase 1
VFYDTSVSLVSLGKLMEIRTPFYIDAETIRLEREAGSLLFRQSYKLIDLFSGAGGLTLGFTQAFRHNFIPIWANDNNKDAVATYNINFGDHCTCDDIVPLLANLDAGIPQADVVIGGPPCQGFSLLNKNKQHDPRKQLWRPFLDVVQRSGAEVFVMENVPQLLDSLEFLEIRLEAERYGFLVAAETLCAADYGVPQRRYRAFIIGCKFADPVCVFPPKRTHYNPNNGLMRPLFKTTHEYIAEPKPWQAVRGAIGDLEPPIGTGLRNEPPPYNLHFGRNPTAKSLERYKAIPDEGMNRFDLQRRAPELTPACWIKKASGGTDLFGRLWWDRPAFTIRTEFFKPEKGRYLHPAQHRPITHREAARLQTFPDSFHFIGSKIEIAKQIGNAVPPLLAAHVADCVYALLSSKEPYDGRQIYKARAQHDYVECQEP